MSATQESIKPIPEKDLIRLAESIIERKGDLDETDEKGVTLLHLAAFNGYIALAKLLLLHGANPNVQDGMNVTPLHLAARNGFLDISTELLSCGAEVDLQDRLFSNTPLHNAASRGHEDIVYLLLAGGFNPEKKNRYGETPLDKILSILSTSNTESNQRICNALKDHIKGIISVEKYSKFTFFNSYPCQGENKQAVMIWKLKHPSWRQQAVGPDIPAGVLPSMREMKEYAQRTAEEMGLPLYGSDSSNGFKAGKR